MSDANSSTGLFPLLSQAKRSLEKLVVWDSTKSSNEEVERVDPDPNLFELIKWKPWIVEEREQFDEAATLEYIQKNPNSLKAEYEFKAMGRGTMKGLPLQRLISLGASVETIRRVRKLYPPAMTQMTEFRSTALHSACSYGARLAVIQYILKHYPDAIRQTTKHVFLPLHNACDSKMEHPIPLETFQWLVGAYPEALLQINKLGEIPLKTARRNGTLLPEVMHYLSDETEKMRLRQSEETSTVKPAPKERNSSEPFPSGSASATIASSSDGKTPTSSEFF